MVNGHLNWQGIAQPDARNVGITGTLSLCVGGVTRTYVATTDASGSITFTTTLTPGTYTYQLKGVRSLATAGTLTISSGPSNVEFGNELAGDANADNIVNSIDFNILKSVFGQASSVADFDNDSVVNSVDFNLLKGNFSQQGAQFSCP